MKFNLVCIFLLLCLRTVGASEYSVYDIYILKNFGDFSCKFYLLLCCASCAEDFVESGK